MDNTQIQISNLLKANHEKLVQDWLTLSDSKNRQYIDHYFKNLDFPGQESPPAIPEDRALRLIISDYKLLREVLFNFFEKRNEMNSSVRKFLIDSIDKILSMVAASFVTEVETKNNEIHDILNAINDGFLTMDKNFIITQMNKQHARLSRKSREEQLGKNFFDVFPGTKDPQSDYGKAYHKAMKERISISFESYYQPLDIWTHVNVIPKGESGIAVFYSDITVQKKAQNLLESEKQKFETLFTDSSAAIALLRGENFVFEKINTKYAELLKGRPLINKPLFEAVPELKNSPLSDIMRKVYETGEPYVGVEQLVPIVREAGGPLIDTYFDFTYSRIEDSSGKSYGIYIHAIDVTEKVNARKVIEKAVNARDEFLLIASHELKTPLTSLKLQIQFALRRLAVANKQDFTQDNLVTLFENNINQVNRLIRLVDDMLDISRIESGKFSYHFERINLCDVVKDIHQRFRETFENNNSFLSLGCEDEAFGNFDKERIEQVLINLLTNALKYGGSNPVALSIKTEKNVAIISVVDHGRGIDSSNLERIFERFERLVSANEISGLGIGLFVSKQIVEAHHGKITVESTPGKGSTFTVTLPLDNK